MLKSEIHIEKKCPLHMTFIHSFKIIRKQLRKATAKIGKEKRNKTYRNSYNDFFPLLEMLIILLILSKIWK